MKLININCFRFYQFKIVFRQHKDIGDSVATHTTYQMFKLLANDEVEQGSDEETSILSKRIMQT